jgi:hypothetical protein
MKILELTLADFRGAPNRTFRFGDDLSAAPVTLITAARPSGKTSVLEAIVAAKELVGSYGYPPLPERLLRHGAAEARLAVRWLLDDAERGDASDADGALDAVATFEMTLRDGGFEVTPDPERHGECFSSYGRTPSSAKLEYFNFDRAMRPELWRELEPQIEAQLEGGRRVGTNRDKYGFVRRYLGELHTGQVEAIAAALADRGMVTQADHTDALGPLRGAVAALAPDLGLARVTIGDDQAARVWFARRDGGQVELEDLSASEHQAVLFAVTFARQGLARSLVLVDAPERDIPPGRQLSFFRALVGLAPEGQIIAATSSREIVEGMTDARVIDLDAPA